MPYSAPCCHFESFGGNLKDKFREKIFLDPTMADLK